MIRFSALLATSLLATLVFFGQSAVARADAGEGASSVEVPPPVPSVLPGAYAFATAEGQANGAVFMKIYSTSKDRLVGAKSPLAKTVELHTHVMEGDVMSMRRVDSIDLPNYGTTILQPGGDHIMLIGLTSPLVAGQTVPLTLIFEEHGTVEVLANIVPPGTVPEGENPPAMDHSGHKESHH